MRQMVETRKETLQIIFSFAYGSIKVSDELSSSTDWHCAPVIPLKCLNRFSIDILSIWKISCLSFLLTEVLCC